MAGANDNLPVNVDFIINSPQAKQAANEVKNAITGTDDAAVKSTARVSQAIENTYTKATKDAMGYAQAIQYMQHQSDSLTPRILRQKGHWNGLGHSINQVTRELPAFAVSAQIGILALSNNIPILADEIKNLRVQNQALVASGQKGVPIWKSILSSTFSWMTGLSIAITLLTLYGKEIGKFFSDLFKGSKAFDSLKEGINAVNEAFKSKEYQGAIRDVFDLRSQVDLAKKGMIDAEIVVKNYNKALGDVTGEVEDLATAEQYLVDKSDAYIKAMLYRTAASQAAKKAAEELATAQMDAWNINSDINRAQDDDKSNDPVIRRGGLLGQYSLKDAAEKDSIEVANYIDSKKKDLEKLTKETAEIETKSQDIVRDFLTKSQEIANKFSLNLFGKEGGEGDPSKMADQRKSLLDRIAAIDREYARKKLDDDEAEVQALRDKFTKIKELIVDFNAKVKDSLKIDMDQVNDKELELLAILRQVQAADDVAETVGRLEKKYNQVQTSQGRAQANKDRKAQNAKEAFEKQLEQFRSYEQRRLDLTKEYQEKRIKFIATGHDEQAKELDKWYQAELGKLDDAMVQQLDAYKKLYGGIDNLSMESARAVIESARDMAENAKSAGRISEEQYLSIIEKIKGAEQSLSDRLPDNLNAIGQELEYIGRNVAFFDEGLGEVLYTAGGILQAVSTMITSMNTLSASTVSFGVALQSTLGVIGAVLSIITLIGSIMDGQAERDRARDEARLQAIRDAEVGEMRINQLYRERATLAAKIEGAMLKSLESQKTILQNQQNEINKEIDGYIRGLNKLIQTTFSVWANLDVNTNIPIEEINRLYNQLYNGGLNIEDLRKIYESGSLTAEGNHLFEMLLELEAEGEDIEQALRDIGAAMKDIFTGGATAESIADTIIEGFRNGKRAVEDFAEDMETILQNAVLSAFKYRFLEEPLNDLIDQLARDVESDGVLTPEEIEAFSKLYNQITGNALDLLNKLQNETGLDLTNPDGAGGSNLAGAIRRELTEGTANELAGLYRAQFDVTKRMLIIDEERIAMDRQCYEATLQSVAYQAAIEVNTRETVVALQDVKVILNDIKSNTKNDTRSYGI